MKTNSFQFIKVIVILFVISLTGCEKAPKYEIYENKVIYCCGVQSPTENLGWLNKVIKELDIYRLPFSAKLFENVKDKTQFIVAQDIYFTYVYDCEGNLLFGGHYNWNFIPTPNSVNLPKSVPPAPCDKCDDFFKEHRFVGLIYEQKLIE